MTQGRPLGAKLFLEGVEVPFIGATITSQVNTASIAYIDLVPHYLINNIKPRTHVLLSVRDYHNKEEGYPYVTAWEGEVFGTTYNRTFQHRSFSISCIDVSSYWDNVISYFINYSTTFAKGVNILPTAKDQIDAQKQGYQTISISTTKTSYFRQTMDKEVSKGGDLWML